MSARSGDQIPALRLVIISAGVSEPSSTRLLADRTAQKTVDLLRERDMPASVTVVELAPLAVDIAQALVSGFPNQRLQAMTMRVADADALIVSTPVYKAAVSGLQVVCRSPRQRLTDRQADRSPGNRGFGASLDGGR